MDQRYVRIDLGAVLESPEANPTDVRMAHRAMHVLTTFTLVNDHFAFRAFLRAITRCPLRREFLLFSRFAEPSPIGAGKEAVCFRVAGGADGDGAGRTSQVFGSFAAAIRLCAAGSYTIAVLIGVFD